MKRELKFFFKNYGKSAFMVSMSQKLQSLGIEQVWERGRTALFAFFVFYLIRDTILYIVIPIYLSKGME